jgi:hypothetical protein
MWVYAAPKRLPNPELFLTVAGNADLALTGGVATTFGAIRGRALKLVESRTTLTLW